MKKLFIIIVIGIFLSTCLLSGALYARGGGHGRFYGGGHFFHGGGPRVVIGGYFGYPYYYPYGYYPYPYYQPYYPYPNPQLYYPDAYTQTPTYVEPQQEYYWYYCNDSQTYYPYVTSCPGGWTQVVPTPPQPAKEGVAK